MRASLSQSQGDSKTVFAHIIAWRALKNKSALSLRREMCYNSKCEVQLHNRLSKKVANAAFFAIEAVMKMLKKEAEQRQAIEMLCTDMLVP